MSEVKVKQGLKPATKNRLRLSSIHAHVNHCVSKSVRWRVSLSTMSVVIRVIDDRFS